MFEEGKTNEEVLRHYAEKGITIPEAYITKTKKYFENYKELKLKLGFLEQEAKDFRKTPVLEDEPSEDKQLASGIFNEEKKEKKEKKGKKGKDNINIDTDEVEVLDDVESIDGITINIKEVIKKELTKLKK